IGNPASRFNRPISCATDARWLIKSTTCRSRISTACRHSAISMPHLGFEYSLCLRPRPHQTPHQFPYSICLGTSVAFNRLHYCAPHHHRIGKLRQRRKLCPYSSNPSPRHGIHEPRASLRNPLQPRLRTSRCRQKHWRQFVLLHLGEIQSSLFHRQIRHQRSIQSRFFRRLAKLHQPHPQNWIQIRKDNQPSLRPQPPQLPSQLQHVAQRCSIDQSSLTGPLDHRPIRHGIAEGHSQLNHVRPSVNRIQHDIARHRHRRISARHVHHQPRPFRKLRSHPILTSAHVGAGALACPL